MIKKVVSFVVVLLIVLFVCAFGAPAFAGGARPSYGRVTRVFDGDTLMVSGVGCIRLDGIDAPEKDQPYGAEATALLKRTFLNKPVEVEIKATDKYGRKVARVYLSSDIDPDMTDASKLMLDSGLAWWYKQYSSDAWLAMLERDARKARKGLWKQRNPEAPWHYRHSK